MKVLVYPPLQPLPVKKPNGFTKEENEEFLKKWKQLTERANLHVEKMVKETREMIYGPELPNKTKWQKVKNFLFECFLGY